MPMILPVLTELDQVLWPACEIHRVPLVQIREETLDVFKTDCESEFADGGLIERNQTDVSCDRRKPYLSKEWPQTPRPQVCHPQSFLPEARFLGLEITEPKALARMERVER